MQRCLRLLRRLREQRLERGINSRVEHRAVSILETYSSLLMKSSLTMSMFYIGLYDFYSDGQLVAESQAREECVREHAALS